MQPNVQLPLVTEVTFSLVHSPSQRPAPGTRGLRWHCSGQRIREQTWQSASTQPSAVPWRPWCVLVQGRKGENHERARRVMVPTVSDTRNRPAAFPFKGQGRLLIPAASMEVQDLYPDLINRISIRARL